MSLATLAEIGIKAIALQEAVEKRRAARSKLLLSYAAFRGRHNNSEYITKGTDLYNAMMASTAPQLRSLATAERVERNARARLERASKKGQQELAAGVAAARLVRRVMESAS